MGARKQALTVVIKRTRGRDNIAKFVDDSAVML
jgi:hypothetical protein